MKNAFYDWHSKAVIRNHLRMYVAGNPIILWNKNYDGFYLKIVFVLIPKIKGALPLCNCSLCVLILPRPLYLQVPHHTLSYLSAIVLGSHSPSTSLQVPHHFALPRALIDSASARSKAVSPSRLVEVLLRQGLPHVVTDWSLWVWRLSRRDYLVIVPLNVYYCLCII